MIVVADTSPLNYLALVGEVDVLPKLFTRVVIPEGVAAELRHPKTPVSVQNWIAVPPVWMEIKSVAAFSDAELMGFGRGEREAIFLAETLSADLILMDERKGFVAATQRRLRVAGTLFVLEEAAAQGLIELPSVVEKLRSTSFRIAESVLQEVIGRDAAREARRKNS
jgi:predicted nucleic acid-binding protein